MLHNLCTLFQAIRNRLRQTLFGNSAGNTLFWADFDFSPYIVPCNSKKKFENFFYDRLFIFDFIPKVSFTVKVKISKKSVNISARYESYRMKRGLRRTKAETGELPRHNPFYKGLLEYKWFCFLSVHFILIVAIACIVLVSGLIPNWTGFSIHFGWVFNFFSLIFNSLLNITKRHFKRHGFAWKVRVHMTKHFVLPSGPKSGWFKQSRFEYFILPADIYLLTRPD